MKESTLWILQFITGAFIFFLLMGHVTIIHYSAILHLLGYGEAEALKYAAVVARSKNMTFVLLYIAFLGFALYHGLYGLRNIIAEFTNNKFLRRAVSYILIAGGTITFIYGTYAAIAGINM